jgi:hypothetical protein
LTYESQKRPAHPETQKIIEKIPVTLYLGKGGKMPANASAKRSKIQGPFPLVNPQQWERRKAEIQRRHPDKDAEFYQDPQTGLWTLKTICRKTGETKIVAAHAKPFSALHFGMERLVNRLVIRRSLRPGTIKPVASQATPHNDVLAFAHKP